MAVVASRRARRPRDRSKPPKIDRAMLWESERLRRRLRAQHERARDEFLALRMNR